MNTQVANADEYHDLPLSLLSQSTTNPRCSSIADPVVMTSALYRHAIAATARFSLHVG